MNNWCIFLFFTHIFTGNFNFKGLTAQRLYNSFGVKGLMCLPAPQLLNHIRNGAMLILSHSLSAVSVRTCNPPPPQPLSAVCWWRLLQPKFKGALVEVNRFAIDTVYCVWKIPKLTTLTAAKNYHFFPLLSE
jgi:hypothetical protein